MGNVAHSRDISQKKVLQIMHTWRSQAVIPF